MNKHIKNPNVFSFNITVTPDENNNFAVTAFKVCPKEYFGKETIERLDQSAILFNANPNGESVYFIFTDIADDLILKATCAAIKDFSLKTGNRSTMRADHCDKIGYVDWCEKALSDWSFTKVVWSPSVSRRVANYGDKFIAAIVRNIEKELAAVKQLPVTVTEE